MQLLSKRAVGKFQMVFESRVFARDDPSLSKNLYYFDFKTSALLQESLDISQALREGLSSQKCLMR